MSSLIGGYHDVGIFFDRVSKMTRIVNMLNLKMGGAIKEQGRQHGHQSQLYGLDIRRIGEKT